MFEELIFSEKNKIQVLLDKCDFYKISDIINNDQSPKYFAQFLQGHLIEQLSKIKVELLDNYGININDLELYDNWRVFEISTYDSYKLNKNKIDELINDAVQLNLNFLIRPKQTLVNFLFRDELFQLTDNIKIKLQYFNPNLEIISKIDIWLEEQNQLISIFKFRSIISNIISNYFKENQFTKVADWFAYLIDSVEGIKFSYENSTFNFISIFANDLNWNGLHQFLNLNKDEYINTTLSNSSINKLLSNYLALWHKEETDIIDTQLTEEINKEDTDTEEINVAFVESESDDFTEMVIEEELEGDGDSDGESSEQEIPLEKELASPEYNLKDLTEVKPEFDEYDKMLMEEAFEGEGESYGTDADERQNEEIDDEKASFWNNFTDNNDFDTSLTLSEDIEVIDEILAEVEKEENVQVQTYEESSEISEDDEFEKMAALIAGGEDIVSSTTKSPTLTQSETISSAESFSKIENIIEKLNNLLNTKIGTGTNLKEVQEFAQQTRLSDLNFIDLKNPQFSQTKKELYELLIDLKRKKFL